MVDMYVRPNEVIELYICDRTRPSLIQHCEFFNLPFDFICRSRESIVCKLTSVSGSRDTPRRETDQRFGPL